MGTGSMLRGTTDLAGRKAAAMMLVMALLVGGRSRAAEPPQVESAAATAFAVLEYRVLGNTVLQPTDIEAAVYPHLGPGRTFSDVEAARVALEDVYHARGFGTVFVDIPEQSVQDDGVVRLRVTEGRLRRTQVQGAKYSSGRELRALIPQAAPGTVPELPRLQSEIYAVNAASPDRSIVPALKAGPLPGTVDLTLNVQDTLPFHGTVEVNNQYTAGTSELRALTVLGYDNLFGRLDSLALQFQVAPQEPSEVSVIAASYLARLDDNNSRLSLSYVHSSSDLATLGALNVIGKGSIYGLRYIRPLVVTAEQQSQASIGIDYKDFAQDVRLSDDVTFSTPIAYTSLSAAYNLTLRHPGRVWNAAASITMGLSGLGSRSREFADKCFGCRPNFLVLRADGALRQDLPARFFGVLQLAGQYTVDPVISNEQMSAGGVRSVRGYLEAESLGDIGWRSSLELHAPNYLPARTRVSAMPYTFYSLGRTSYQRPLPGQAHSQQLSSWGLGLDLRMSDFANASLNWAYPLVDGPQTPRGDSRWEFAVRTSW